MLVYKSSEITIMANFVANVNGVDGKGVVVKASSQQEASQIINDKYGKTTLVDQSCYSA